MSQSFILLFTLPRPLKNLCVRGYVCLCVGPPSKFIEGPGISNSHNLSQLWPKKSRIGETLNLLTDEDSSMNTKTDRNGQKGPIFNYGFIAADWTQPNPTQTNPNWSERTGPDLTQPAPTQPNQTTSDLTCTYSNLLFNIYFSK